MIVRAELDDVPGILALANWAAEHTHANFATQPETLEAWQDAWETHHEKYPWLVSRADGKIIAFAKAGPHRARGAYAWIAEVSVYVQPDLHRRGLGCALYGKLIPLMRAQGYMTLLAGITPPNPGSEGLHAAFGFQKCGVFHRAGFKFGRWFDVGYWELHLQAEDHAPAPIASVDSVW